MTDEKTEKKGALVLLVEDDAFLVNMYTTKLGLVGFTVISATDGEKGLEIAKTEKPDVVLLDVLLPGMDGFAVLKKIRSDAATKDLPVILLTNLSKKEEVDKGLALGANDYLIKAHFMPSEVVAKIKRLI